MRKNDYELIYKIKDEIAYITLMNRKKIEFVVEVDREDIDRIIKSNLSYHLKWDRCIKNYYVESCSARVNGKQTIIKLHRWLMGEPEGMVVDHINGISLDNKKCNLRITTKEENSKNRQKENSNNKSGYRNVSLRNGKYIVQLQINKKNTILGSFYNVHEAGAFAYEMRVKHYGLINA